MERRPDPPSPWQVLTSRRDSIVKTDPGFWYEKNSFWGPFTTALAIIFGVVTAMTKDIRWLLFGAWPFASIALWVALNSFVYKKCLTTFGSIILLIGIFVLHQSIRPENKDAGLPKGGLEQKEQTDKREPSKETIEQPKIESKKSKPGEKPKQTARKAEQKAEEIKPESAKVQPDISAQVIFKKGLAVALRNVSPPGILVRDPKSTIVIWNLDLPDHDEPLPDGRPITKTFNGTWIRQEEIFIILRFTQVPEVVALIKPGHRLFGWISVSCPDCTRTKAYWIYAIHGKGGWYSEISKGFPSLAKVKELLPQIRDDPEAFFADIPQESRIGIEDP